MSVSAVMYVYLEEYHADSVIAELGVELMQQFDLTAEDFPVGGPLLYLPREDYDLAHVEGKPGFLLDVNLYRNYYYAGYERGDLPLFVGIAEWLEQKLLGCRVFYGADTTGDVISFDASVREILMAYHNAVGWDIYFRTDLSREQKDEIRALHSENVPMMGRRE